VIKGDPAKEGMYVVRLKVPAGFKIAAHTHPNNENVTVLSGSFNIGTGDKLDPGERDADQRRRLLVCRQRHTNYACFTEDTVRQLHGMGPQGVTYVDPGEDPRRS
jgi:anti-sigma factor ChrR (cupin superfamily)